MRISGISNNYNVSQNYNLNKKSYANPQQEVPSSNEVSFRGGKESKFGEWISKFFGKYYGKPMYDKEWVQTAAEKMTKFPGRMTEHMSVLGSIFTSIVYMYKTLTNENLEQDNKKTLAINQCFCCVIPTILGYTVANKLMDFNKKMEYRYRGLKEQQVALKQISEEEAKILQGKLGRNLKSLGAFMGLLTFTLIYRYITPVVVTPISNWIGNKLNAKDNDQKPKEIAMQPETGKVKTAA